MPVLESTIHGLKITFSLEPILRRISFSLNVVD